MNVYSTTKVAFKAALVAATVLAFNLFFLASTLTDGYQELSVSRFSTQLSQIGDRLDVRLNAPQRQTLAEIRQALENEKRRLLRYADGLNPASIDPNDPLTGAMLDLSITLRSGDVVVSSRDPERPALELPYRLQQVAAQAVEQGDLGPIGAVRDNGLYFLSNPLFDVDGRSVGMVVLTVDPALMEGWVDQLLDSHSVSLASVFGLVIAMVFVVVLR